MTTIESLPAGLRGVVVSDTAIGDVRGAEGYYHYRGRSAVELARTSTFDDAAALVLDGELPDEAGRARFRAELAERRELPDAVHAVLPTLAAAGHEFAPLAGLRAALATLGAADDLAPVWGATPRARRADALRVVAATPTILAALYRLRRGLEPVGPRDDLHGAAAWLHLLHGTEPDPQAAAAVEHYLVATIDHGFNASTFTARVAASAGTDVASAVVAALGTFAGPLHGGAPDRALEAVDEIGSPTASTTTSGPSSRRATGSWGSGTRSTGRPTRVRSCCTTWPVACATGPAATSWRSPRPCRNAPRRCSPSTGPAATCGRTSSSGRAW